MARRAPMPFVRFVADVLGVTLTIGQRVHTQKYIDVTILS